MHTTVSDEEKFDEIIVVSIRRHGCHDIGEEGEEEIKCQKDCRR